jgi:hypothetical protein
MENSAEKSHNLCIFGTIRHLLYIFILLSIPGFSQKEKPREQKPPYDRKEEILSAGKRYRLYNNYVTAGGGIMASSIRGKEQKNIGINYHFHIQRQYFQAGLMMSGEEFLSNNQVQGHLGYGWRKETSKINLAFFGGLTYFNGVIGRTDTSGNSYPEYYSGGGLYVSGQLVTKLSYDIGIGIEIFAESNKFAPVPSTYRWYEGAPVFKKSGDYQQLAGFRLILFFSGAYRGVKKNYNPHVRAENGG